MLLLIVCGSMHIVYDFYYDQAQKAIYNADVP
jgi:hypothetical protein